MTRPATSRERILHAVLGRTRRRRIVSYAALTIGAAVAIDALFIEPFALEITRHHVRAPVDAPITIAHLTDLHTQGLGRRERLLLERLEAEKPDLIVITGDTVDGGDLEPARELMTALRAPLGVWVVRGNWENWQPPRAGGQTAPQSEAAFYTSVGARFLVNEGQLARRDVWIAGLDDPMSGHASPAAALEGAPAGVFTIVLVHSPEGFGPGLAPGFKVDLALAGHTHGGQVRLPFVGPLWLPPGSGGFVAGWYESGGSRMYVSRGIGTSILPVRFLCSPELALITVAP